MHYDDDIVVFRTDGGFDGAADGYYVRAPIRERRRGVDGSEIHAMDGIASCLEKLYSWGEVFGRVPSAWYNNDVGLGDGHDGLEKR